MHDEEIVKLFQNQILGNNVWYTSRETVWKRMPELLMLTAKVHWEFLKVDAGVLHSLLISLTCNLSIAHSSIHFINF